MVDMNTMLRNQLNATLTGQLNAAVQAGDIAAAHNATKAIAELAVANVPQQQATGPKFDNEAIKKSMQTKAPWFGTDPRRSAKAVEFARNMEPTAFATVEAFSDALIKAVDDEFKPATEETNQETEEDVEEKDKEKPVARKKTDAPSGDTGRSASRAGSSGPWGKLSDAPKETADLIRTQADKFTRTKETRDKFITSALGVAYADAQRKGATKK